MFSRQEIHISHSSYNVQIQDWNAVVPAIAWEVKKKHFGWQNIHFICTLFKFNVCIHFHPYSIRCDEKFPFGIKIKFMATLPARVRISHCYLFILFYIQMRLDSDNAIWICVDVHDVRHDKYMDTQGILFIYTRSLSFISGHHIILTVQKWNDSLS